MMNCVHWDSVINVTLMFFGGLIYPSWFPNFLSSSLFANIELTRKVLHIRRDKTVFSFRENTIFGEIIYKHLGKGILFEADCETKELIWEVNSQNDGKGMG